MLSISTRCPFSVSVSSVLNVQHLMVCDLCLDVTRDDDQNILCNTHYGLSVSQRV